MKKNTPVKRAPRAVLFLLAIVGCSHEVRPDSMSAEQHRQTANQELTQAHTEAVRAAVTPPAPPHALGVYETPTYPLDVYNPAEQHMTHARQLEAHAKQHEKAANQLEAFVEKECQGFPPESRSVCPMLGPVSKLSDIPGGVSIWFTPKTRVDAVAAHMRCHFAHAQAHGFDTLIACPLYVRGLEIRVSADGKAIELTSQDAKTAEVIRTSTRDEAMFVRE